MASKEYCILRFYRDDDYRNQTIIKRGLTREEAVKHCQDPETSSSTCTSKEGVARTEKHGPWFDGFDTWASISPNRRKHRKNKSSLTAMAETLSSENLLPGKGKQ